MKIFPHKMFEPKESGKNDTALYDLKFKEKVVQVVTLKLALVSGAWTYEGAYLNSLRVGGQNFATVASAGLLAIAITSGIMAAWWVMMSVIPTLNNAKRVAWGLVLNAMLQVWMLAVSSSNNLVAQSAPAALISHMEHVLEDYEEAVDSSLQRALAIKPFLGILKGEAESRCAQAKSEVTGGSVSGSKGTGAISGTLELLCVQSQSVATTLEVALMETENRADEATELLKQLDATIRDHSRHVFERETAFLGLIKDLEGWLRLTDAEDLTRTLKISHAAMAASVAPPSVASGQFGEQQIELISGLRTSVEKTGAVYQEMIGQLDIRSPADVSSGKRISLIKAVWRSRMDHIPQIAAAIGIDFFQLFMVLSFLLAGTNRSR